MVVRKLVRNLKLVLLVCRSSMLTSCITSAVSGLES
jgi:hypothetical protein